MSVRAFVAIGLPGEDTLALQGAQEALRHAAGPIAVKWARPSRMHLTLRFLGDIADDVVGPLGSALADALAPLPPFELALDGLGGFPSPERARVIWAGIGGDLDALRRASGIARAIAGRLAPRGEERDFVPHLTLGRVGEAGPAERAALASALASVRPQALSWRVDSVRLMRSILKPEGAEHSILAACALQG